MAQTMSNQFNSKAFKDLQAKWYKKLKDENFQDIEDPKVDRLKSWHSTCFLHKNAVTFSSKQEYFELCMEFSHEYTFSNETDKKIWDMHSEGFSLQEISNAMKNNKRGFRKTHIYNIVCRLINIMKEGSSWKKLSLKKIS